MGETRTICSTCDIFCQVKLETDDGKVTKVRPMDPRKFRANICIKAINAPEGFEHPDRVLYPLKRSGPRGSGQWERVSWDDAMSDIAARLKKVVAEHGPEAFAVSASPAVQQNDGGMGRRFMNLLGSPNWTSGVSLCMGNTGAVNRMVYGWFPYPDYTQTKCIVLFGHDPKPHSWTSVYNSIRRAQESGAKLIVVDPCKSLNAKLADLHLPLRPGTDAALMLGWVKVIIDEELYDKDFVANWTTGFDELRERVNEFPLERVAEITGLKAELIAEAARIYATSGPSVIPWTPITDQQRNSTSAIRLHCTLRAICGYLDIPGGEIMHGFHPDIISETDMELHDALPEEKRMIQLGANKHPVFTHRGMKALREPTERVWGNKWANLVSGNYMAAPQVMFRAMADGDPYPVKAFFAMANNTLLSYPNMQLIHRALENQDLIVAFEQFKSPTAQMADYILPSDAWTERNGISDGFGWMAICRPSQKAVNPPGECRGVFDFWRDLAHRMGFADYFPWESNEEMLDHRVEALGMNFEEFAEKYPYHMYPIKFRKYEEKGFATPSGKVELRSSILEELGFDPLPYYRPEPDRNPDYPLIMFIGIREDEFFQTGGRHHEKLRARNPEPRFFISPLDATSAGVTQGDWAECVTINGKMKARIEVVKDMPQGVLRVPHGWWQPERAEGDGSLSGAWEFSDSQICPDDDEHTDREQGVTQLKGVHCRIQPLVTA